MTQQAIPAPNQQSLLMLVKSNAQYQTQIQQLTNTAWYIAYTALWNTMDFSTKEKNTAKEFISNFLLQAANPQKAYTEFVQRVLLARQYIGTHPGTYIPLPCQWFSLQNIKGFIGTNQWFQTIQVTRESLPQFKIQLRAFAEAIQEIIATGTAKDFHYWRSYFIQHNAQGLLNLMLSTIANYQNRLQVMVVGR